MKRHKILENDQYTVWINANKLGTYTQVSFDVEQPDKHGNKELQLNKFQLYMLPSELREFAAFLQTL
jgi:hypothetical protein